MHEVDYLVVGAGAMGMAFADTLLTETDATIAIVDRRPRPGGHWNDAYPHVRLHQPSAFYGVNSRELGTRSIDRHGWNEGLSELASGSEVVAYFDQVMRQQFLASGRVQFHPLSDYEGDGVVRSIASGARTKFEAGTVVDAGYMNVSVPATHPPRYAVGDGVRCVPPNALSAAGTLPVARVVVVGAGKTAIDACLFLLEHGVDPHAIQWIRPRDQWCLDRARIQPGVEFFEPTVGGQALQLEAVAACSDIDDLFARLEANGLLLRLDTDVRPTMYRCATVSMRELAALRSITDVVRLGRVQRITVDEIVLDDGVVPSTPDTLYIDCSADGLERRPAVPVFDGSTITLQTVRTCQQVFSAAFIGHVEAAYDDETLKNELATVVPHPDSDVDWLRTQLGNMMNSGRWRQDADLTAWLTAARLDAFSEIRTPDPATASPEHLAVVQRIQDAAIPAAMKLMELLDQA